MLRGCYELRLRQSLRANTSNTGDSRQVISSIRGGKIRMGADEKVREGEDERSPELKDDLAAQADELGGKRSEVGPQSAGQAGSSLGLSAEPEATEDSVEGLSDTDQALEAASVEG